ncbi:MAG TPA: glycosyl hydrolase, partial [Chroococcales cyanobacterium]
MAHHDSHGDRAEPGSNPASNRFNSAQLRDLYGDPQFVNRGTPSSSNGGTASYLDFSTDPYHGQSNQSEFDKHHPWRAKVIHNDISLHNQLHQDAGHLDGHYNELDKRIHTLYRDEEREAKNNGGHLTNKEYQHLLARERHIHSDMSKDFQTGSGDHHPKPGHGKHRRPPGSGDPPPGSGDPPPGSGDPPPPVTGDGHVIVCSALQPKDYNASYLEQGLTNFDKTVGVDQGIQMMYVNQNLGKTPDVAAMQNDAKNGVIPMLSLRTVNYADVASGKDDAYLQQVANDLKQVNGTVYLRPNWEMDGGKRQQYGTPQEYIAAWQHMHDFMQKAGVTNVKWVWAPDAPAFDSKVPSWSSPAKNYYPGSQYVDLIGADGYSGGNGQAYKSPEQIFSSGVAFANQEGKPFIIAETGVNSSLGAATDAQYMQQMTTFIENNPDIQALSWFSEGANGNN